MSENSGQGPRGSIGALSRAAGALRPKASEGLLSALDAGTLDRMLGDLKAEQAALNAQQTDFEVQRTKHKKEQLVRERQLQTEIEAREKFFADRERKLFERQKEVEEQLTARLHEVEMLRATLKTELSKRELAIQEGTQALEVEKARYNEESRKKIQGNARSYVSEALETLSEKETQFHALAKTWSVGGALSLVLGLCFFVYVTLASLDSMPPAITWEFITFVVFKGLIAVGLFGALTKYAFLFSNSYMREALKNADRRHAINFGKFYLESYGAAAEWGQIKEAFEHWNIAGSNSFNRTNEPEVDATVLDKAAVLIEKVSKSVSNVGKGGSAP